MRFLALLLLALPLAAQSPQIGGFDGIRTINISPAGTWEAAILLMLGQLTETMDSLGAEVAWLAAEEGESEEEG